MISARHRALVAEPDRAGQQDDVGGLDELAVDRREVVGVVPVLAHVGPDARRDRVVDGAHLVDADADALEDPARDRDQAVGLALLRRALQRAVEDDGAQVVVARGRRVALRVDEVLDRLWGCSCRAVIRGGEGVTPRAPT